MRSESQNDQSDHDPLTLYLPIIMDLHMDDQGAGCIYTDRRL